MQRLGVHFCLYFLLISHLVEAQLRVGVAKVNATLPVGVPLGGYSARKTAIWPIPEPTKYTTWMKPSTGHLEPTWAKAVVINDGKESFCFVAIDAIGADGTLRKMAYDMAVDKGFLVPYSNFALHGSHTHSGPGAITDEFLWEFAPAMDLVVPELQTMMASHVAAAMLQAAESLQPAVMGIGLGELHNVTINRRAHISPYLNKDSIDPNLAVIRFDDSNGKPLATVWNFAIHGVCWGPDQLLSNGDIMGGANEAIETLIGGVSLFINADAGDISPAPSTCVGKPKYAGAPVIAEHVEKIRSSIPTSSSVSLQSHSVVIPFGETDLNLTLARVENCTHGGPLDICSLCTRVGSPVYWVPIGLLAKGPQLKCDAHIHLDESWVEENPTFSAFRFDIAGKHSLLLTAPGEALSELGFQVRKDVQELGFDYLIFAGYSNNHMGYFATAREYDVGGYESLLTMWGVGTAEKIRQSMKSVASEIKP